MQELAKSAIIYFSFVVLIYIMKPEPLFDPSGRPREFGCGDRGKTLFTVQTVTTFLAVMSYYFASLHSGI